MEGAGTLRRNSGHLPPRRSEGAGQGCHRKEEEQWVGGREGWMVDGRQRKVGRGMVAVVTCSREVNLVVPT